jgi:hypothetical protein
MSQEVVHVGGGVVAEVFGAEDSHMPPHPAQRQRSLKARAARADHRNIEVVRRVSSTRLCVVASSL